MDNSSGEFLRYETCDTRHPSLIKHLNEINESEETKARCLQVLRKELQDINDIEPCLDEAFLTPFLRVSKHDTSKAVKRVVKYHHQMDAITDIYLKLPFPLQKAESIRHLEVSPYRCRDNSFLLIGRGAIDYKKFTFAERFYLEVIGVHQILQNPVNQVCGGTYIFDYEGMDIRGFLAFTPFWVRLFADSLLNAFPCRLKAVHIVNTPSFYPLILRIVFPFLPKKIQSRVFLHAKNGDWSHLHSHIPPEILPERFGGRLKQSEIIDWSLNLREQEAAFLRFLAFGRIKTKCNRLKMGYFQ